MYRNTQNAERYKCTHNSINYISYIKIIISYILVYLELAVLKIFLNSIFLQIFSFAGLTLSNNVFLSNIFKMFKRTFYVVNFYKNRNRCPKMWKELFGSFKKHKRITLI